MGRQVVLFNGLDTSGYAGLWVTNGTAGGTFELAGRSNPSDMTIFNGEVLFASFTGFEHSDLCVTDGTAAGTYVLFGLARRRIAGSPI